MTTSSDTLPLPPANGDGGTIQEKERPSVWKLTWRALFLSEQAYAEVRDSEQPLKRGALALAVILSTVVVARLIGLGLGLLATPRVALVQQAIYERLVQSGWYMRQVESVADFANQFNVAYAAIWQIVRLAGGLPAWSGVAALSIYVVLTTLLSWLIYGLVAHGLARWFGGQATLGQFLGVLALAYAPLLLLVVELVPGANVAFSLALTGMLIAKFLVIRTTHGLNGPSALAVTLLPYLLASVLTLGVTLFATAIRISQIPYVTQVLEALRVVLRLRGTLQ